MRRSLSILVALVSSWTACGCATTHAESTLRGPDGQPVASRLYQKTQRGDTTFIEDVKMSPYGYGGYGYGGYGYGGPSSYPVVGARAYFASHRGEEAAANLPGGPVLYVPRASASSPAKPPAAAPLTKDDAKLILEEVKRQQQELEALKKERAVDPQKESDTKDTKKEVK
ncbi:hypothetical protein L0Y59_01660 [Candidatus Uhrbacteria bacterium]|nr:hypothetical protein [Candidatus Uhrbacteria bacterium]